MAWFGGDGLLSGAKSHLTRYPFKLWGFGEEIALQAMLGLPGGDSWVQDLVRPWCEQHAVMEPADHVAPGWVILDLFEKTEDPVYLEAALRLAEFRAGFDGLQPHRPDLPALKALLWVDCMAIDGPFFVRLARLDGDGAWADLGVRTISDYVTVLADPEVRGLFRHTFDTVSLQQSSCLWARGNGWALHGLVDTLEFLPTSHKGRSFLLRQLAQTVLALASCQADDGRWHTILDDKSSPLENSTTVLFASAVLKAERLRLLSSPTTMIPRALRAIKRNVTVTGALEVSGATPGGNRDTYVNAPLGVFPWGQGPLLLTLLESKQADWKGEA